MIEVLGLMLAAHLLLTIAQGTMPYFRRRLPLGGNELAQLGVCLGLAAVYIEVAGAIGSLLK
jgi:hypothetical protein